MSIRYEKRAPENGWQLTPSPLRKKRDARDEWQSQDNERCSTLTLTWLSKILTYNASVNNNIWHDTAIVLSSVFLSDCCDRGRPSITQTTIHFMNGAINSALCNATRWHQNSGGSSNKSTVLSLCHVAMLQAWWFSCLCAQSGCFNLAVVYSESIESRINYGTVFRYVDSLRL